MVKSMEPQTRKRFEVNPRMEWLLQSFMKPYNYKNPKPVTQVKPNVKPDANANTKPEIKPDDDMIIPDIFRSEGIGDYLIKKKVIIILFKSINYLKMTDIFRIIHSDDDIIHMIKQLHKTKGVAMAKVGGNLVNAVVSDIDSRAVRIIREIADKQDVKWDLVDDRLTGNKLFIYGLSARSYIYLGLKGESVKWMEPYLS